MRAWRSPKGLLIDRGPTQEPVLDSLVSDLPEGPPRELHEFLLIDTDQDESDARLNTIEFRKVAGHVARARGHLDRGLRQDR